MNSITRVRIEEMITRKLDAAFASEERQGLNDAIELAVLEFEKGEEIKPLLEVVFNSCQDTDEVLIEWSKILNDYAKVA
ncbi:hypothetical protein [Flagellimonas sp.]|uniref:hypothetical protein n=1 Tax=Flagellimonas sp. TaxID=2058762 RepID=UPI003BA8516E